jgi:hypothetical protein
LLSQYTGRRVSALVIVEQVLNQKSLKQSV